MGEPTETELIARCLRGEAEAWDTLFDRYYDAAGRFVFQFGSDFSREDVEEICQETFLNVVKNLASFKSESRFQTWLFRIAANQARDYRQRAHAAKRGGGQAPVSLNAEEPATGQRLDPPSLSPGPDAELLNSERITLMDNALQQLDMPCRELVELRYFGDLSYEEIAQELVLNPKTVSSRLSRCLDRLEEIARRIFFAGENSGAAV